MERREVLRLGDLEANRGRPSGAFSNSALLRLLRSRATCKNAGLHSGEPMIADKDEGGGSTPPRPTIRPLASGNAAQPLALSRFLLISKESTGAGPLSAVSWRSDQHVCEPLGSLPGCPTRLHSGRRAHYFAS
jgi:hypothetical protein